jgi:hypothetical protein
MFWKVSILKPRMCFFPELRASFFVNITYSPVSSAGIKMFWKVMETGLRVMGTAREGQLKRIWA